MTIPPLRSHLLPMKNMTGTSKKTDIERILDSLAVTAGPISGG